MQDIRIYHKHRKADCADADFLETQGPTYQDHSIRRFFQSRFGRGIEYTRLFPSETDVETEE
jgi:hypothetical protein